MTTENEDEARRELQIRNLAMMIFVAMFDKNLDGDNIQPRPVRIAEIAFKAAEAFMYVAKRKSGENAK